jgi:hypothetical protein
MNGEAYFTSKGTVPLERNMIARRHCFFYWSPEIPPAELGYQAPALASLIRIKSEWENHNSSKAFSHGHGQLRHSDGAHSLPVLHA